MIETPVKAPPPSGPPSAPPPDVRTRVMDPPPDPGSRYQHACAACGLPLHEDQAACLSCGAMVEQGSGFAGIRRAAVGSATALLVLGSAVGAAVAGLPHGKHVGKPTVAAAIQPKKPIPPATADATPAPGSDSTTDLPSAGTGSKPPAIAPETPHGTPSSGVPTVPSPGSSGGTSTGNTGGSTAGDSGSDGDTNSGDTGDDKDKGGKDKDNKPPKDTGPKLYTTGEQPVAATVFKSSGASNASGADRTFDQDSKTAWTTKSADRGIMIAPGSGDYKAIGIVTATPGWSVKIWYSDAEEPGGIDSGDWHQVKQETTESQTKIDVKDAERYLIWVQDTDGKPVSINEIQVFE